MPTARAACPRRRDQSVRGIRGFRGARLARLPEPVRGHREARPDLRSGGGHRNRYLLSKQADVLMLFYLLSPGELTELFDRLGYPFDPERDVPRNVDWHARRKARPCRASSIPGSWRDSPV